MPSEPAGRKVVFMDDAMKEEVRLAAFEDRVSESELVRRAVREYLDERRTAIDATAKTYSGAHFVSRGA